MDPITAFVVSVLMMLLNGAVLGFMHRDLPPSLRPSATAWRFGTLLVACGCMVLAAQQLLPPILGLPLGNALLMAGLAQYWRSLRLFTGLPGAWWLWVAPVLGTAALAWFVEVHPSLAARVVIASSAWVVMLVGSARTLWQMEHADDSVSRRTMIGILLFVSALMLGRGVYFSLGPGRELTILDPGSWVNALTPILAAVLPIIGTTTFLLMVSERLRRNWERAASTDHLTGLSNRRTLSDVGGKSMATARAQGEGFAVAIVDVDHFKSVNDRFGHDVGDLALKHVAARLRAVCRHDDLPARHGGEEFVVVLHRVDAAGAKTAGERLRQAVADAPLANGAQQLSLTVSVGVALLTETDASFDDLLRRADKGLYQAKEGGRNQVVVVA
ncbi:MAG: GGDEF domain-containing protein [Archangium sp.]|nr:GGDEF domain-containing protein [Archangium sp.]